MGSKNGKPVLRPEDKAALAKSSGHTEDMVEQEFDKFMKEYPDGKLNKASFNKMMSQVPLFDSRRSSAFEGWHANLTSSECALCRLCQRRRSTRWRNMSSASTTPTMMALSTS